MNQNYYFIHSDGTHPIATITDAEQCGGSTTWTSGKTLTITPPTPITYRINCDNFKGSKEQRESSDLSGYAPDDYTITNYKEFLTPPIMHRDLLAVIRSVGEIEIEEFETEIKNPLSGTVHTEYRAINVTQVAEFEVERDIRKPLRQREFKLPVSSYLLFRLHDDGPVVVHESIKDAIESAGISGVYFIPSYENY